MSATNNKNTQDPEVAIENALTKTELFFEKNGKKMIIVLIAIIAIVGGYFGYEHLYRQPRVDDAAAAMAFAQGQFEQDSMAVALNGNGKQLGFTQIADQFSGTPQANLAYHYAGICYLNMGEYQKAIDNLKKYSPVSNSLGDIIAAQNLGLTADAYSELGDLATAIQLYEKAAALSDNIDTTPTYLHKAAIANLEQGNNQKALEQFQSIKNNYPQSIFSRDVDKYIALTQQKL